MGPILLQNTAGVVTVLLTLQTGGPALGLTTASMTVGLRKFGESTYTAMSLASNQLVEIGNGVYDLHLLAADTDVVGNFTVRFGGTIVTSQLATGYVTDALPVDPSSIIMPANRTGVYGYLKDVQGNPIANADVFARVVGIPVHDTATGYSISSLNTKTDDNGFFFLTLVTAMTVNIVIPAVNYSRTLLVPNANANLFGIS